MGSLSCGGAVSAPRAIPHARPGQGVRELRSPCPIIASRLTTSVSQPPASHPTVTPHSYPSLFPSRLTAGFGLTRHPFDGLRVRVD